MIKPITHRAKAAAIGHLDAAIKSLKLGLKNRASEHLLSALNYLKEERL